MKPLIGITILAGALAAMLVFGLITYFGNNAKDRQIEKLEAQLEKGCDCSNCIMTLQKTENQLKKRKDWQKKRYETYSSWRDKREDLSCEQYLSACEFVLKPPPTDKEFRELALEIVAGEIKIFDERIEKKSSEK